MTYLAKYLPGKSRVGGTAIAYVLVVAILGAFAFLIVPPIVQQTVKFSQTVPGLIDSATTQWHGISSFVQKYNLQPQVDSIVSSIKHDTSIWASDAGKNVVSGLGSVASILASMLLVLVLSFLMLVEGPMWLERLWGVYNNERRMERHRRLMRLDR